MTRSMAPGDTTRGAAFAVLSRGSSVFVLLLLTPYLLDELGPAGFGVWVAATALLGLITAIDFGLVSGLGRLVAHASVRNRWADLSQPVGLGLAAGVLVSVLLAGVAVVVAPTLADALTASEPLEDKAKAALRVTAATAPIAVVGVGFETVLAGLARLDLVSAGRLLNAGLLALGAVVALESGGGLLELALAQLAGWMATVILAAPLVVRAIGRGPTWPRMSRRRLLAELLAFGVPRQVSRAALVGALQWERLLVGLIAGAAATAGYGVASMLAGGVRMLLVQATLPLMPLFVRIAVREGEKKLVQAFAQAVRAFVVVAAGVFGALAAVALPLGSAWVGPTLDEAPRYIQLLIPGFFASCAITVAIALTQAAGRPGVETRGALAGMAVYLPAAAVLVAAFGAEGAAIGTSLGLLVGAIVLGRELTRRGPAGSAAALRGLARPPLAAAALAMPVALFNGRALDLEVGRETLALIAAAEALLYAAVYLTLLRVLALNRRRREPAPEVLA